MHAESASVTADGDGYTAGDEGMAALTWPRPLEGTPMLLLPDGLALRWAGAADAPAPPALAPADAPAPPPSPPSPAAMRELPPAAGDMPLLPAEPKRVSLLPLLPPAFLSLMCLSAAAVPLPPPPPDAAATAWGPATERGGLPVAPAAAALL